MQVTNVRILEAVPEKEYFTKPGFSFSGLKGFTGVVSEKMSLGKLVDQYITSPEEYNYEQYEVVRGCASALITALGEPIMKARVLKPQLCLLANFEHEGLVMAYKGRPDLAIVNRIIIDIKVGTGDPRKTIDWMGYIDQLSGYAYGANARAAIIAHVNPAKKYRCELVNVPIRCEWWERQILINGQPKID